MNHVEQQTLVGADPLRAEALVEIQVELDRAQRGLLAAVVGALGQQMQLEAVARLQVDHQLVGRAERRLENRVRRRPEVDHDVGVTCRQPFSGAKVERHAGPAPVGDLRAQRNKGLGGALAIDARLVAVRRHRFAARHPLAILTADHMLRQCLGGPGFQRPQHLELFVADRVGVGVDRRLHRHRAQQLQRVVLHHVAQGAGVVVESAAFLHAKVFGHGDLDVGDRFAPPERLEQRVAKSQREQVLHRGLAQVVVDPENLPLAESAPHHVIDLAVGRQVVPQRLLQHDPGFGRVQSRGRQLLAGNGEQRGRRRQVHHDGIGLALAQQGRQLRVIGRLRQVHPDVVEQGREAVELLGRGPLGQIDLVEARPDQRPVLGIGVRIAGDADDAATVRQGAVAEGLEQCRHQLAPREVAGAAKKNEVETHGLLQTKSAQRGAAIHCNLLSFTLDVSSPAEAPRGIMRP